MRKINMILFFVVFLTYLLPGQEVTVISPVLNKMLNVRDFCVSPNEDEAFFTIQSPNQDLSQIVVVRNKKWKRPELLPFCDGFSYLEPFLSKDGKRLYFASNRPKTESGTLAADFDIWYVERQDKNSQWSKPINLGTDVNSELDEFYPTLADNGNLYITIDAKSGLGKDDIYCCKWDGKQYSKPKILNAPVNSEGYEFNAFIAPDESFLIYTKYNAADGLGSGDLYVSKRSADDNWGAPKNLGAKINTPFMEYCPFYEGHSKTLYFTSRRSNLKPRKFKNTAEYLNVISESENGLSKIYKSKLEI